MDTTVGTLVGDRGEQFSSIVIDDVTISTGELHEGESGEETFPRHLRRIEIFLARAKTHNIQFKLDKSQFAQRKVDVLGFVVGCGERSAQPAKVEALRKWPDPKGCDVIVSSLAFVSFLRDVAPAFSR